MKIYLDTSCILRPFDDLSQFKMFQENEAVKKILRKIESGEYFLTWSFILEQEAILESRSDDEKAFALSLRDYARENINPSSELRSLAKSFMDGGLKLDDALHLAAATIAKCDYLITGDNQMLNCAVRLGRPAINPVSFAREYL